MKCSERCHALLGLCTVDLHTPQIEGFFHAPVDTLTAVPTLCRALRDRLPPGLVVVSPDDGRVRMAMHYAQCLGAPVIVLYKRRENGAKTEVTHVVGDVSSRACLIVDDMISTGGTVAESIRALLRAGTRPETSSRPRTGSCSSAHGQAGPPRRVRDICHRHGLRGRAGLATTARHLNRASHRWCGGAVSGRRLDRQPVLRKRASLVQNQGTLLAMVYPYSPL